METRQKKQYRMDFRGRAERDFPEYVRRSMLLRKQRSAYDGMHRVDAQSVKQGGTAGNKFLSRQIITPGRDFLYFPRQKGCSTQYENLIETMATSDTQPNENIIKIKK